MALPILPVYGRRMSRTRNAADAGGFPPAVSEEGRALATMPW